MVAEPFVAYDYVFPVVGGDLRPQASAGVPGYVIRQVYGTAFCLAENFFVTNHHVIKNASAHPWWGIGFPEDHHWEVVPVERHESWSSLDIGICSAQVPRARHLKWCSAEQAMLTEVQASGFPYALDLPALTLMIRSFRGTVVAADMGRSIGRTPRVRALFPVPTWHFGSSLVEGQSFAVCAWDHLCQLDNGDDRESRGRKNEGGKRNNHLREGRSATSGLGGSNAVGSVGKVLLAWHARW